MARKKTRSKARTVKTLKQSGTRKSIKADRKRTAKTPGVRISESGNKYTETRRNRSDRKGSKL